MRNILDFYEFIEERIRKHYFFKDSLNEGVIKDLYEDVFKKITKIINEKILVVNSVSFAERLSSESSMNKIVCIYSDKSFEVPSDSGVEYRFVDVVMNSTKISRDTAREIEKIYDEFKDVEFDKIFNFSFDMETTGYRYECISEFNFKIFKLWFVPGITSWYSFDEFDVHDKFSKMLYEDKSYRYKIGKALKIDGDIWKSAGFDGVEDRFLTHLYVRESGTMGGLSAEELDKGDMIGTPVDFSEGILKHYIEPRIYSFRSDMVDSVLAPDTALKVGDTDRGVLVRMDEWRERFPDLEHLGDWSAVVHGCGDGLDGKVFRDYDIHKILESFGKIRVDKEKFGLENIENKRFSNEFFYNTKPEDVEKAIEELHNLIKKSRYDIISRLKDKERKVKKYVEPTHDRHIKFKERKLQEDTIDNFDRRCRAGEKELLMYAVMRFGKTYTACRCAQKLENNRFTVVVSAKADVKYEWLSAVNPYVEFKDYDMYLAGDEGGLYEMLESVIPKDTDTYTLDDYLRDNPEKHVMLFLTLQDLARYVKGGKSEKNMKKYDCFISTPVDLLIIDEAHYGAQGKEYGKGIGEGWDSEEGSVEEDDEISASETKMYIDSLNLANTVKLHLSGTPYDLVARGKFGKENMIADFGFEELMEEKEKWIRENMGNIKSGKTTLDKNPYFGIPNMVQFGYDFNDFDLQEVLGEGKVNFLNLFRTTGLKFKYENEILGMLKAIDGTERKEGVMAILDSPDIKKENMCKHIVMVLPRKEACDAMEKLLNDNRDVLKNLGEYKIVKISTNGRSGNLDTNDAKEIIKSEDEAGNKTISLTVVQMLTGVSVPEWDTMFYMKDGDAAQPYDQARFRIQTPNIGERIVLELNDDGTVKPLMNEDGKYETMKIDRKPQTLFVDFSSERCYKVLYDKFKTECEREGKGEEGIYWHMKEKLLKYMKFMPIVTRNVDKLQEVEIENMMKLIFSSYTKRTLKGTTAGDRIGNMDFVTGLDFTGVDTSFLDGVDDSYEGTGSGAKKKLSGRLVKGAEHTAMDGKDSGTPVEGEPSEEYKEDGSETVETEERPKREEKEEYFEEGMTLDEINRKCKTIMKNIVIYMLCRNDNMTVFDNMHDLVWDSMGTKHKDNYNIILNIFNPEHANEKDSVKIEKYVQDVRDMLNEWYNKILKHNRKVLKEVIAMMVSVCMTKEERRDFNKIKDKLDEFGKGAIGATEFITPEKLCEKLVTDSDGFVIFNKESKILDCYGSKTGEILYYISENHDFDINNYYIVCRNGIVAELNKLVFKMVAVKKGMKFTSGMDIEKFVSDHVLVFDPTGVEYEIMTERVPDGKGGAILRDIKVLKTDESDKKEKTRIPGLERVIQNKWKGMKFDIIVGNPPYGVAQKGSTPNLHLKIMNSVIRFCTDKLVFIMPSKPIISQLQEPWFSIFKNAVCNKIEVVGKEVFKNTEMDNTAIYYCDRNDDPKNYCKKLDVDNAIYNAIDSDAHRLFIDKIGRMEQIKISFFFESKYVYENQMKRFIEKSNDDKFYLNVNRATRKPGKGDTQWLSDTLEHIDILSRDDEIEFCKKHTARKNIIECPTKEYGENLKNLMINGFVLRYSLWLKLTHQEIFNEQFKYVPDVDYSTIKNDFELLSICGLNEKEIESVIKYLNVFDFSKNRNSVIRDYLSE